MTLLDRAESYAHTFSRFPASHLWPVEEQGSPVLYGLWKIGNCYRNKTALYGAYPRGFLERVWALFPDFQGARVLHAFSGSLGPGPYVRLDVHEARRPDVRGDVVATPFANGSFDMAFADPPYSPADAVVYQTRMVDRRRCTAELARIVKPGGFVVWLDTTWPMFSKEALRTVAQIGLVRSTNHRVRLISIFERRSS